MLREGYELISEALNLLNNVYGPMHAEIAACLRLLARLNYIMGEYGEVSERKDLIFLSFTKSKFYSFGYCLLPPDYFSLSVDSHTSWFSFL